MSDGVTSVRTVYSVAVAFTVNQNEQNRNIFFIIKNIKIEEHDSEQKKESEREDTIQRMATIWNNVHIYQSMNKRHDDIDADKTCGTQAQIHTDNTSVYLGYIWIAW